MRNSILLLIIISLSAIFHKVLGQKAIQYDAIYSGIPWMDNHGNTVSAHGANIVLYKGRYYLFGEAHTDSSNAFAGFNCYSSVDLYNWDFETVALGVQRSGKLGKNRVGERPKVMRCPKTGEFVMFMHVDTLNYKDQFVGYATAKNITGPYVFQGPLLFDGKAIRKWDLGTFQDKDGLGYVLLHGGEIYKLSDDYKSISKLINQSMTSGFESPAIFRKDSIYYFLGSNLTSWERNDNYYFTATSLSGPWTKRGLFAPKGTLSWNSQTTFVLPIQGSKETTYLFMGDRWSFPKQATAATYVWQPLNVSLYSISIPEYKDAWQINTKTGAVSQRSIDTPIKATTINNTDKRIKYSGQWHTDSTLAIKYSKQKDASFSVNYTGKRIAIYGMSGPDGGYARVNIRNSKGKLMLSSIVDMYCQYGNKALIFISPNFAKDNYELTVSVLGQRSNWSDKRKNDYGSKGYFISVDKLITNE